ncbi:uncharacterized protein G2W53_008110 [Senna tora]|uniref:Uncharacterized protein n=1 Tax=Senna tora TaxID=362788 RepID=A0A834X831_9FABA|nr:uncharacterized protein G2W53_008110 [Senna tora]
MRYMHDASSEFISPPWSPAPPSRKFCLRSATKEACSGGGSPSSSSFIIRMDEYNQWIQ